nr:hypothetical protein [Tanacetum cinerariifolium]
MPPEDDVFLAKEQPLPVAATPTADSLRYILQFDPKGDLEEDDEEDPEEDPTDYPADSIVVALPAVDHVSSEEVTKPLPQIPSRPLPIPSPPPDSPTRIEIPESCLSLRKRLRFASPTPGQKVVESSAVGVARQDEPTVVRDDPYSLVREGLYGFVDRKMAPKRTTRSTPVVTTPAPETTTSVTNAQLQAMIDQGITDVLAARDANRNGDDSHTSGTGNALTWWNSHVKTTTPEAAHAMPWRTLKKMMTDKYCPRAKLRSLKIDKVERYVDVLPDTIHGSVMATKPKIMQDAIEFATEHMNKKINTWVEHQADNQRKSDDTTRNNHQQPNKRQNTKRAYAVENANRRAYEGPRPLCTKCNYHYDSPCAPKCRATFVLNVVLKGISRRNVQKLKNNNNRGNQVGNAKARAKVYAMGKAGANPDNNVVTGTFLLNKHYASILFDTGADRSFVSTAFSSQIIITQTTLDHDYNIKLADGRIVGLNTIIRGCTLNFLNHPFNIDLIPIELGSFDVIIGMDWLAKYHAVIICVEKIIHIPFGDEILIVRGYRSSNKHRTRLNIMSYTKTQEYLTKGCHVFLANITATKDEEKSKGKRLEDLLVVQEFPEVFS